MAVTVRGESNPGELSSLLTSSGSDVDLPYHREFDSSKD